MEETTSTGTGTEAAKRPTFLTVLCILSFIAAGLGILAYIGAIAVVGAVSAAAGAVGDAMSSEAGAAMEAASAAMSSAGPSAGVIWAYIIVGFITTIVGLFGVIKMWKLQKVGFFIYTGCSVASMVMGMIYSGFSVMGVLFPVLFIVLYGMNLKHMK
ncbi:MAG: hypothetical protein IPM51_15875 [Sphingobacteriaceae bacterium]|nr:hypothetical protein [Sphingobacteriaceae bacterium]